MMGSDTAAMPPRPLHEINAKLAEVEKRIMGLLREVTE